MKTKKSGSNAMSVGGVTQSERFMQAARELECDDDPERFKERVKKLAKVAPDPSLKEMNKEE